MKAASIHLCVLLSVTSAFAVTPDIHRLEEYQTGSGLDRLKLIAKGLDTGNPRVPEHRESPMDPRPQFSL